jgi:Fe-S-cluster containining protein
MGANDGGPEDPADGLRFTHAMDRLLQRDVQELGASFAALLETLEAGGALDRDQFATRQALARTRERFRDRHDVSVAISNDEDKHAVASPDIDCAARLPLCRARCCTMNVALSARDLDERILRWDLGRPYLLARSADGYCVHHDGPSGSCTVYQARPASCRRFDCRSDRRIWADFEGRIPAGEP